MPLIDYTKPAVGGSKAVTNLKHIFDDDEFDTIMQDAGDGLVVIDFSTTWCAPCRTMESVFQSLAEKFPHILFLKVDADKCDVTAMKHEVTSVPYFVIYLNQTILDRIKGASPQELEVKIRRNDFNLKKNQAQGKGKQQPTLLPPEPTVVTIIGKLGDVAEYLDRKNCHCISDLSPTPINSFLDGKKMVAGRGSGKLNLVYSFVQKMKISAIKVRAPATTGPKTIRFFVNEPKVLDFPSLSTFTPSEEITLQDKNLSGEQSIELKSEAFEIVTNFQVFIAENMSKTRHTEIESIIFYGAPLTVRIEQGLDDPKSLDTQEKPTGSKTTKKKSK